MQDIEGLLNDLRDSDWWVRKGAVEALGNCPEESYIGRLEEWLRDGEDALLRNAAMEALRGLGSKALGVLIRLLGDNDEDIRIFSANLLGEMRDSGAFEALSRAAKDSSVNVRVASIEALGKLSDKRAIGILKDAVGGEPWVTMAAVEALGEIGGKEALDFLHGFLDKDDYRVVTINALGKAGNEETLNILRHHIYDDAVGAEALGAFVGISQKTGLRLPAEHFTGSVARLIECLGNPDGNLRKSAFIALTWTEEIRALPYLIEGVNDEELQEYAIYGLFVLGKKAVPAIVDALKNSGHSNRVVFAKILSMMGEEKALVQFAADDDPEVRCEVALALGTLKTKKALGHLTKMLEDPSEEVREAARLSMEELP